MKKRIIFISVFNLIFIFSFAQNTTVTTQANLNPQPVFFGGGIILGGGSGSFQFGLNWLKATINILT